MSRQKLRKDWAKKKKNRTKLNKKNYLRNRKNNKKRGIKS